MRLFQSQDYLEDCAPPPPYNLDREATRSMPIYLNQFRDGRQRLPTPEKVAIMELSSSFERRRLGKHQQILTDITQRCREQEVSDLSSSLSAKVNLQPPMTDRSGKEMTFYSTNFMGQKPRGTGMIPDVNQVIARLANGQVDTSGTTNFDFERSYKNFPARKVIRQQTKFDFIKGPSLPKISSAPKVSSAQETLLQKSSKRAGKRRKHASMQGDLYKGPKVDHLTSKTDHLAPLVVPNMNDDDFLAGSERMDTYFLASRVTLGPRTQTNTTLDSNRSGKNLIRLKPIKVTYTRDISSLHIETGGNSPPPNSEQEPEAVTV